MLVASPALADPNFLRVVVFLLEYDEGGAIGVVLNRPSDTRVEEVVPSWALSVSDPPVVFGGGPVAMNGAICLARVAAADAEWHAPATGRPSGAGDEETDAGEFAGLEMVGDEDPQGDPELDPELEVGFRIVTGSLGTVDLHRTPEEMPVSLAAARVFAGYAGWAPAQLDSEIDAGAWFVVEALDSDVFDAEPEGLWPRVLRRQSGWLRVLANYPPDPSVN